MLSMRFFVYVFLFIAPLHAFAYTSVIAKPADQAAVLPITNPINPQEFFGHLLDFPHTFEFTVREESRFRASVFVEDSVTQQNDASIIIVKNERRGVSEIGRTRVKEQSWEPQYDAMLAESFRSGGLLEYTLVPGTYKLEVSSPDNKGNYRLVLGTEKIHRGYLENVRVLFEVKAFLGHSPFGVIQSPLIYWPLVIIILLGVSFFGYKLYKTKRPKL